MARRKYYKKKYKKPSRRSAKDEPSKARSLQGAYRKATDKTGTLSMADARKIVSNPPDCPYCKLKIPWRDISIDHIQPRSKDGASAKENLVYCDKTCNMAKGDLSGPEFMALMEFLR